MGKIISVKITGDKEILATTLNQTRFKANYAKMISLTSVETLELLKQATPTDSGETREAWKASVSGETIDFANNNEKRGYNVVSMLSSGTQPHDISPSEGRALANQGGKSPWGPFAKAYSNKMLANKDLAELLNGKAAQFAIAISAGSIIGFFQNGGTSQIRLPSGRFGSSIIRWAESQQ